MTPGGSSDPGAERHRILRQLRQQLYQHPAVDEAMGRPEGAYAELTADVDPTYFGRGAESATLRLVWHPNPDVPGDPDQPSSGHSSTADQRTNFRALFKFHYSEAGGYDCGFHNEPNPHVGGWFHFQERDKESAEYRYEPASLDARTPTAALWELLDLLSTRLAADE